MKKFAFLFYFYMLPTLAIANHWIIEKGEGHSFICYSSKARCQNGLRLFRDSRNNPSDYICLDRGAGHFDRLAIYENPNNTNIKFIQGQRVTDDSGKLLTYIPNILRSIEKDAELENRPNPISFIGLYWNINFNYINKFYFELV